jgi:hypothetical protein
MTTVNQYLNEICNCTCCNCDRFIRSINATFCEEVGFQFWVLLGVREACEHKYYQEIL